MEDTNQPQASTSVRHFPGLGRVFHCLSPNLLLTPILAIRGQCSRTRITIHGLGVSRPFYHLHRHQQHHRYGWVVIGSSASELRWRALS